MIKRCFAALLFVALPIAAALAHAQTITADLQVRTTPARLLPPQGLLRQTSGLQLAAMDEPVDPCTDFYQFACGGWMAKNPVPADRSSWGRFEELQERNNETLRRILETPRRTASADVETKKIGDYYADLHGRNGDRRRRAPRRSSRR